MFTSSVLMFDYNYHSIIFNYNLSHNLPYNLLSLPLSACRRRRRRTPRGAGNVSEEGLADREIKQKEEKKEAEAKEEEAEEEGLIFIFN